MPVYKPTPEEHDAIIRQCITLRDLAEAADLRARVAEARGRAEEARDHRETAASLRTIIDIEVARLAAREVVGTLNKA